MRWRVVTGMRPRVAALTLPLALAGCSLQQDVSSGASGGTAPARAPVIAAQTVSGQAFHWSSVRGHVTVIDFWASWCGPCRAQQRDLNAIVSKYAPRGAVFVGVDLRDGNAAARAFENDFQVRYPSVADPDEQISAAYNVAAPPVIVVVDKSGRIVDRLLATLVGLSDDLDRLT